jgi:outer membrane protein assembly factor BamB
MTTRLLGWLAVCAAAMTVEVPVSRAGDWPMWRYDAGRTAASPERLPPELHLQWTAHVAPRRPVWDDALNQDLMPYDRVFEPIVAEGRVFLAFNDQDKLVALQAKTGAKEWTFYADAPIRLAPAAWQGRVYVVSDDSRLYCLDAQTGNVEWSFQGGPSPQKVIGNRRIISAWPARGGPVVKDGHVYFAASIWPFMGVFIYALDAETGRLVWVNDATGSQYLLQPHKAPAFAGVAPQGALVATREFLLVPGGRSVPAAFRRSDGEFQYFHLDAGGKANGGSFVVANESQFFVHTRGRGVRAFELATGKKTDFETTEPVLAPDRLYASEVVKDQAVVRAYNKEDKVVWEVAADATGDLIQAGNCLYGAGKTQLVAIQLPPDKRATARVIWSHPVEGPVSRLLAADGQLYAVTLDGRILAFGSDEKQPAQWTENVQPLSPAGSAQEIAQQLLKVGDAAGYALWFGADDGSLLSAVIEASPFLELAIVDEDPARVAQLRQRCDRAGLYGKVSAHVGNPREFLAPPYIAQCVFVGRELATKLIADRSLLEAAYHSVRPYGGTLLLLAAEADQQALAHAVTAANLEGAQVDQAAGMVVVRRPGALPGSADWTHQSGDIANTLKSNDKRVKLPLGLLWFGGNSHADVLPRHGHGPPEQVIGGRLFIEGMNSLIARDVYTGRALWQQPFANLNTKGVYYDETYKDTPLDPAYNQVHIPGANARGTNFVATADRIYVVEGTACRVLDPVTGRPLQSIELPQTDAARPEAWGFVGVYQDILLGGAGFADYQRRHGISLAAKKKADDDKDEGTGVLGVDISASLRLVAFNRYSGQVLWQTPARHSFVHNGIVAGGEHIYCLDRNPQLVEDELRRRGKPSPGTYRILALNCRTGERAWEADQNIFGTWLSYSEEHDRLLEAGASASDRLPTEAKEGMAVYRGRDGVLQWRNDIRKYSGPCILYHDQIITNANSYTASAGAFSLLDGSPILTPNPLSGDLQPWTVTRAYGCNNIIGSENLLTFRSGAAGFYDLVSHSGTGNFGGFKSGCTSNLVIANGVLNAPDYTRTCSCAYQNQTSLALVPMPDVELWAVNSTAWSLPAGERIRQIGINFGAPGDRRADNGTLWVEYPESQSDGQRLAIELEGTPRYFRRHASTLTGARLSWVHASGVEDATVVRIPLRAQPASAAGKNAKKPETPSKLPATPLAPAPYRVLLYFTEPQDLAAGQRVFDVYVQGQRVLQDLDIAAATGQSPRVLVKTLEKVLLSDQLEVRFAAKRGRPVLSGIELQRTP